MYVEMHTFFSRTAKTLEGQLPYFCPWEVADPFESRFGSVFDSLYSYSSVVIYSSISGEVKNTGLDWWYLAQSVAEQIDILSKIITNPLA